MNRFKQKFPALVLGCVVLLTSFSDAQCHECLGHDEEQSTQPPREFVSLQLELRDSSDQPIVGASVRPYALRTSANWEAHFYWNPDQFGPSPTVSSDSQGNVDLKIPKFAFPKAETGEVSLVIQHEDFIEIQNHFATTKSPVRIMMERGLRYRVQGIDAANGQRIRERLYGSFSAANGVWSGTEWKQLEDGTLRSIAVTEGRQSMWLFHVPDSGPTLFCPPFRLSQLPGDGIEKQIPDQTLRPGHRLEGRLDDTIERPVKNGHVVLQACTSISNIGSKLTWHDFAMIKEDGTFVFESVPRDCIVMLVAVCEGGLSAAALTDELAAAGIQPEDYTKFQSTSQVVPFVVRSAGDASEIVIPMGHTASVSIRVVDLENKPLAGAVVSSLSNQLFPGFGANLIGDAWCTRRLALLTSEQQAMAFRMAHSANADNDAILQQVRKHARQFYLRKTDAGGMAPLKSLPGSSDGTMPLKQKILIQLDGFQIPDTPREIYGSNVSVDLVAGQTTELTVVMVPENTD